VTQPAFSAIRQALADTLSAAIPGLRATANRPLQINPPMAVIMPAQGAFATYSTTMDGQADYLLRAILVVAPGDSTGGEDLLDPYIATTGGQSVWAAVQANQTLGGVVSFAEVTQASGYGLMNMTGVDYLAVTFTVSIGV